MAQTIEELVEDLRLERQFTQRLQEEREAFRLALARAEHERDRYAQRVKALEARIEAACAALRPGPASTDYF